MRTASFWRTALAIVVYAATSVVCAVAAVPEYTAVIVKSYPHDPRAFTEGLLYHQGFLYESTGRGGQSSIREVDLKTGTVKRERQLEAGYYGEGIAIWKGQLIQLTWKNQTGFVYDLRTFEPRSTLPYPGEGWALTTDGSHLIMSDGTSDLRILDPRTLSEQFRVHVTCEGRTVANINELEWVKGQVYANIWRTNLIAQIDLGSGNIKGLIDLTNLAPSPPVPPNENVANGIAYDAATDRLFVTGKLWSTLYQIAPTRRSSGQDLCQTLPGARTSDPAVLGSPGNPLPPAAHGQLPPANSR
jgi:glutamine cyclotransferase